MFKDFFLNATILIAAFFIMGQIFKNKPLTPNSSLLTKLYWGSSYGILGNILMQFSMQINPTTIADLRHLAIVIPAAFGGFIPAFIASMIIAIGRIFLIGNNDTAILASVAAIVTAILCGALSKLRFSLTIKTFIMNLIGLSIISIVFILKIDRSILIHLLMGYTLVSLVGGFLAFHVSMFISNSNEAHRQLRESLLKLRETEERFRLIAEYSSDMITMHNEKGEYIYISPAVKEIINYEYTELLGKNMKAFIHPDEIESTYEMFQNALINGVANSTFRYKSKNGDYIWIESTLKSVQFHEDGSKKVINVSRNITERKLTEQRLKEANELLNRLSYMDGLTGIANRRYFDQTLEKVWKDSLLMELPLTLIMFDIDQFKKYNDTNGHLAGDLCLQSIAQSINTRITHRDFTLCRYGGEEFALILPSTPLEKGITVGEEIQTIVKDLSIPHSSSEIAKTITLSIGIATLVPISGFKPQTIIQKADTALYLSKTRGRNTISTAI